jgi:transcriptional regulator with PAS, ATPase and Fis domain
MGQDDVATQRTDETPRRRALRRWVVRSALPGSDAALLLEGQRWTLGRGEDNAFRLNHPGVSRVHAEITKRGPALEIRDLGSTNGTFVDGQRVMHGSLRRGAVLRLGEWLAVVEEHADDASGPYHFRELASGIWGGAELATAVGGVATLGRSDVPVVLLGRTGTGKERFARALHNAGDPRRPFHALNCAALPPQLAEAELFGYRKGAFTGADRNHDGHLRAAHGGTLFLDEVAELTLALQAKLLRALEAGELAPLGDTAARRISVRVVSACQLPLATLVSEGRMREDFAARLNGVVVSLPELSERRGDVPGLFELFWRRHSGGTAPLISAHAYECLCLYNWPGNVREVELLARQLLALHGLEPQLRSLHLPMTLRNMTARTTPNAMPPLREHDVELLAGALERVGGNVREAAKLAGLSRQRAYRLIASHHLGPVLAASRAADANECNGNED